MAKKSSKGGNVALMVIVLVVVHVALMLNVEPYAEIWDQIYVWIKTR